MKTGLRGFRMVGIVAGIAVISAAAAVPDATIQPESRVWVEGGSSVRSYTCEAAGVNGMVDAGAGSFDVADLGGAVRGAEIVVDVNTLDCGNGTMNGHMRKALKSPEHGTVRFRLNGYTPEAAAAGTRVLMQGTLQIAGNEQAVAIEGVATPGGDGGVRVAGSHEIRMTDYGVKPPSLMLGTMKVHDPVTLNFDIMLKP